MNRSRSISVYNRGQGRIQRFTNRAGLIDRGNDSITFLLANKRSFPLRFTIYSYWNSYWCRWTNLSIYIKLLCNITFRILAIVALQGYWLRGKLLTLIHYYSPAVLISLLYTLATPKARTLNVGINFTRNNKPKFI